MIRKFKALGLVILSAIPVAVSGQTTYETIPAGSFVVNMGGTQRVSTLKAYGLLFNLMRGQYVPVKWCINPSKGKDGVDFTIGTTAFTSGAFVVPKAFRNATVNSIISTWQAKGVSGITTTTDVVLPVYTTFSSMPRWFFVLDLQNGSIAQGYLRNAEIPDSVAGFIDPKNLNCCHDFFVMPHADPVWTTHARLFTWTQSVANGGCRGSIWAACHAPSALENMINPSNFTQQTNFLTSITGTAAGISSGWANPPNSLVLWTAHGDGTPPYSYRYHADPEMQFLGTLDAATQNGSEQIYLPVAGGGWRSTTKVGVWDPDYVFGGVTLSGSREAAVMAWGRAKGDASAGFVMYEAGHSHNKALLTPNIAAQRAFFNASLMAGVGGTAQNNNSIRITRQSASGAFVLQSGALQFGIKVTGGAGTYTFRSINNCGGTLTTTKIGSDSARLVYTAPSSVSGITDCYVTVIARDGCGRETYYSWPIRISPTPSNNPPVARHDTLLIPGSCTGASQGSINVLLNDSEPDGQPLSAQLLTVNNGTATLSASGNFVFTSNPGFQGVTTATYRACDNVSPTPACSTATIRIVVGTQDSKGCWGSEFWTEVLEQHADTIIVASQVGLGTPGGASANDPESALGMPDGIGTELDATSDRLVVGYTNVTLNTGLTDTLYLTWTPVTSGSGTPTVSLELSTNGTTWGTAQTVSSSSNTAITTRFNVNVASARWARLSVTANAGQKPTIDGLVLYRYACRTKQSIAKNDFHQVVEDRPLRFHVLEDDEAAAGLPDSLFSVTQPPNGFVSINPDQSITYQPKTDFDGKDSFFYTSYNKAGFFSTAKVNLVVSPDPCGANQGYGTVTTTSTTILASRDAEIRQDNATTNYGTDNRLNVGWGNSNSKRRRAVLYFDLTGISTSALVLDAEMALYRDGEDNGQTVNIHAITGTGLFIESGTNSVTWNRRNANNWATAGGDFSSTIQGSLNTGTTNGYKVSTHLETMVQGWVSTPSSNLGVLLNNPAAYSRDVRARFDSRERGSNDPELRITYSTLSGCAAIGNRAPHIQVDFDTTMFPTPKARNVVSNDIDPDGTALNLTATSPILRTFGGTATRSGNTITFTPSQGFNGWAWVQYRITDGTLIDTGYYKIYCQNAPPVAVKDSATVATTGGNVTINVRANDLDPEGATLTTRIIRQGTKGTATLSGNNILYTSIAPQTGLDTVWYAVTEPSTGVCSAPQSDTAIIVIRTLNRPPDARRDTATTPPCITKVVDILANDTDPDGHSLSLVSIISGPFNGTASIALGKISYTPNSTPTPFTGVDSLRYVIADNGDPSRRDTTTLRLVVNALTNGKPVALNDTIFVQKGQTWYEPVLDNDSDPDGDNLRVFRNSGVKAASNGTVSVLANNLVVYTPNSGFVGRDTFAYIIKDTFSVGGCAPPAAKYDTALVFVNVEFLPPSGVNMTVAVNDYNNTWVNTPVSGNVLTNDFDPEGNTISFGDFLDPVTQLAISSGDTLSGTDANGNPVASAGVLTFTNGAYTFTPINGFTGIAIVDYNICDDGNPSPACDNARLTISVDPLPEYNDNNVIANNDFNVSYGKTVGGSVVLNDKDPEADVFDVISFRYDSNGDGIPDANGTLGTPVHIAGVDFTGSPVASAGLLTLNANGSYTFKPDSFSGTYFVGTVNISYVIEDDGSPVATDDALLVINVLPDNGASNDPPFAGDDFTVTKSNTPVTGTWANNDEEPNSDDIRINGVASNIDLDNLASPGTAIDTLTTAEGGTVIFFSGGTFRYTPPAGYIGPDQVVYSICDVTAVTPQPLCASATIYLLVETDNSTVAANDFNNTWVNTPVSGDVTTNDFDPEGDTQDFGSFLNQNGSGSTISTGATLSGVDPNGNTVTNAGTLTFNGNGGYTFTPANGFTGVVTVPYNICDDGNPGKCDTALLRVSVDPMPSYGDNNVIANNDFNVSYGSTVTGDVEVNDSDPEGNSFSVVSYRRDTNGDGTPDASGTLGSATTVAGLDINGRPWTNAGSLTLNSNGTYSFTPASGFLGTVTTEYRIDDNGSPVANDRALLVITVLQNNGPLNDPPFAGDDFSVTKTGTPVNGNWATNDREPNGDSIRINGIPTRLLLTGLPGTATPIDTVTTTEGGTVIFYNDGSYKYTPPTGYVGPDQVTYEICDVTAIVPTPLCAQATIYLLVNPENSTVAANDYNNTWVDVAVNGSVVTNDFDPEGDNQTFGSFLNQNGSGSAISTGATLSGIDTTGTPVSNAGALSFTGSGGYTFTPASGFAGKVTVPYHICDDGNPSKCDTAILTITVEAFPVPTVNGVVANNDFNVSYGDTILSTVVLNDFDKEGDNFEVISYRRDTDGDGKPDAAGTMGSFTTVAGMAKNGKPWANAGSLRLNTDGSYTFAPAAGFNGTVTMRYTIEDDGTPVAKDNALLVIAVLQDNGPLNDPPFAGDDYAFTKVDVPVNGNWAGNDQEPNGDSVRINGVNVKLDLKGLPGASTSMDTVTTAEGGTVIFRRNGTYTYTPPSGYTGPDQVTYEICDVTSVVPTPLCAKATLYLLVGSENSTLAVNDFNNTWVNMPVTGDVTTNDLDDEGDVQTFGSFQNQNGSGSAISSGATLSGFDRKGNPVSSAGVLVFNSAGAYTFTPASGFTGKVSVPYNICDNGAPSKCDTAHLTITVDSLPGVLYNSVIANNDYNISFGAAIGGNVLSNDGDAEGDNIDVTGYRRDTDGDGIPDASGTLGSAVTVAGVDINGAPATNAGSLTLNANGTYSFTPTSGFVGTVTQRYFIEDDNAATAYDTALLIITVLRDNGPANDPPFAGDDFAVTTANTAVTAAWAANDAELNGDSIRLNGKTINLKLGALPGSASPMDTVATIEGGSVIFFTNGTYTYTPPVNYVGPDQVPYEICDVTTVLPQPLCAQATVYLLVPPAEITISGTVFRDGNGLTDSLVNGTPIGSIGGSAFYAYLIEQGRVIDSARVASNGTYTFTSGRMLGDYRIAISTRQNGIKTTAPVDANLPFSFKPVGETYGSNNLAGNGIDRTGSNGLVAMRTGYNSTTATNFGIQYAPIAHPKSYTVNPDSLTNVTTSPVGTFIRRLTLNDPSGSSDTAFTGVTGDMPGVLSGYDDEDGRFNGITGLMNMSMVLDSLPDTTNALLEYIHNGRVYNLWPNPTSTMTRSALIFWDTAMKKYVIPGFDADSLRMLFKFAYQLNTKFYYSYMDSAGVKGPPAPYTINYLSPLPVEIINFGCREREGGVLVSWVTAMEENSDYFAVLRSADGREWKRVATLAAAGFSAQLRNYSWFDAQPLPGVNYYRVLAVDRNGYEESTEICFTRYNRNISNEAGTVTGYPNPTTGRMTIEVNAAMEGRVSLLLTTATGNQLVRRSESAVRGSNRYELDLGAVVPGVYMLRVEGAGVQAAYRVIKQ